MKLDNQIYKIIKSRNNKIIKIAIQKDNINKQKTLILNKDGDDNLS